MTTADALHVPAKRLHELNHLFGEHPPANEPVVFAIMRMRMGMVDIAILVESLVPKGREHALTLTKLEEALQWANAGIARAGAGPIRESANGTLVHDVGGSE